MRFSTIFAACSVAAVSSAQAIDYSYYTMSLKSPVNTINGLYLSARAGKVGVFPGTTASSATKFLADVYKPTGTLSIRSSPQSQIALQLQNTGFLRLTDLENPSEATIAGKPTEWSVFTVDPSTGEVGVKDTADIPSRKFAAYLDTDGVYYVGLWDGFTRQPRSLANVTIIATKAAAPSKRFNA